MRSRPPLPVGPGEPNGPRFYLTGRQPLGPGVVLLALAIAAGALFGVSYGLGRTARRHFRSGTQTASRPGEATAGAVSAADDEDDDPNQIDTIVLGDAADAPVPARRDDLPGRRPRDVHPTILVRLPRFGPDAGLIPDSPAGHLLYRWLAAFNQTSLPALDAILPNADTRFTSAAQVALRLQTGGFNLLSAREVQPGVIVFRLRDQTPDEVEALGTLSMHPGSNPPAIASFSLRAVAPGPHG